MITTFASCIFVLPAPVATVQQFDMRQLKLVKLSECQCRDFYSQRVKLLIVFIVVLLAHPQPNGSLSTCDIITRGESVLIIGFGIRTG